MSDSIQIGTKVFIRNIGKDEYWLQDVIYSHPEKLGLGQLLPVMREKKQITGGRLDILLKDPDDNSMYEVEVMLGETDPSHIIRAIEYWDNEKRRYPQRQHYCVLIAESFDRRYFNVIQLLSQNIPMIAIQTDAIKLNEQYILHFSKILDIYVEPEEEVEVAKASEKTWREKADWTLKASKKFLDIISRFSKNASLNFTQSYISIMINNRKIYTFEGRKKPNSQFWVRITDQEKEQAIKALLDEHNIDYRFKNKDFTFTITYQFITDNELLISKLHEIKFKVFDVTDED